jgi:uncharacterized membrane protein YcaP (DUF421 family)
VGLFSLGLLLLKEGGGAEVEPLTWGRMLMADLPPTFAVEVVLRSIIIFIFAILALRLLGKRGVANLSPFEFAILLAFGSLIGDPTFYHDVGLVFAMVAVATIVVLYRVLAWLTTRSERVAAFAESTPRQLVRDGVLDYGGAQSEHLSHGDVFSMLRQAGVRQLGEVECAFLETSGHISTFRFEPGRTLPGLPIVPPLELVKPTLFRSSQDVLLEGYHSCIFCGLTHFFRAGAQFNRCTNCGKDHWVTAAPGARGLVPASSYIGPTATDPAHV